MPSNHYSPANVRGSLEKEELDFDDQDELLENAQAAKSSTRSRRRSWVFLATNACLLVLNVGILLMVVGYRNPLAINGGLRLPHADWIAPALEYEVRLFDDKFATHGQYRGLPRPELDEAWTYWIRNYTLRVPKPGWVDPTAPNRQLAEFQDEEGGLMGVFSFVHNLHCLKTVREYMLPEFYPKVARAYPMNDDGSLNKHIDHCVDMIRQTLICHADMGLTMFEWREDEAAPQTVNRQTHHVCLKEEKVREFLETNTVFPNGTVLINPWTGEFPYLLVE